MDPLRCNRIGTSLFIEVLLSFLNHDSLITLVYALACEVIYRRILVGDRILVHVVDTSRSLLIIFVQVDKFCTCFGFIVQTDRGI